MSGPDETPPLLRRLDRVTMRLAPGPWPVAERYRSEIDAHYAGEVARNPALWNGQVLLLARHTLDGSALAGDYRAIDYASLLWWMRRDTAMPVAAEEAEATNTFAMAALRSAEGDFILGRMADWTANAGRIIFAAGTPDLNDVGPDGTVDLAGSALRELGEEMGIGPDEVSVDPLWTGVFDGPRIALMREMRSALGTRELVARIAAFLAGDERPELSEAVVVRGPADLDEAMPFFLRCYLAAQWQDGERQL